MTRYFLIIMLLAAPALAGGGDGSGRDGRGCYTCGGGGKVDGRAHEPRGGIGSGNVTGGPGYGTPR